MQAIREIAGAPAPVGPYSPAMKVGELVFCSGQIALDPSSGKIVEGGLEEQTAQVFRNIEAVLKASGTEPNKIVMSSIFLADIGDFKQVNSLYADFINSDAPPARQTMAVKDLPLGARIEISVIAAA